MDVASVSMYSGLAYTTDANSSTSAKLRRACTPPAVAHAPMVTRILDCSRISLNAPFVGGGGDRALHQRHVVGSADDRAGGFEEGGDLHLLGDREQFVLAVQQRQLAAVAGGELPHRQRRCAHLQLLDPQQRLGDVVADDRPVAAQQQRAELAVPAPADPALHVPFKGHANIVGGQAFS